MTPWACHGQRKKTGRGGETQNVGRLSLLLISGGSVALGGQNERANRRAARRVAGKQRCDGQAETDGHGENGNESIWAWQSWTENGDRGSNEQDRRPSILGAAGRRLGEGQPMAGGASHVPSEPVPAVAATAQQQILPAPVGPVAGAGGGGVRIERLGRCKAHHWGAGLSSWRALANRRHRRGKGQLRRRGNGASTPLRGRWAPLTDPPGGGVPMADQSRLARGPRAPASGLELEPLPAMPKRPRRATVQVAGSREGRRGQAARDCVCTRLPGVWPRCGSHAPPPRNGGGGLRAKQAPEPPPAAGLPARTAAPSPMGRDGWAVASAGARRIASAWLHLWWRPGSGRQAVRSHSSRGRLGPVAVPYHPTRTEPGRGAFLLQPPSPGQGGTPLPAWGIAPMQWKPARTKERCPVVPAVVLCRGPANGAG